MPSVKDRLQPEVKEKLQSLPTNPGVYMYFDVEGNILYVGKAKNLRNRVRQYFQSNLKHEKVLAMLSHMVDFRYIITPSEADAFSLENTLIKKYMPPYNIMLKDDKQHAYIKINVNAPFPKLTLTRKIVKGKSKYFGPISGSPRQLMDLINTVYPTLNCNYNFEKLPKNFRPCLNYYIGRCPAPCIGKVDSEQYRKTIDDIIKLLNGDDAQAKALLKQKMDEYSDKLQFEQALACKNQLALLDSLGKSRIAELPKQVDYDVFAISSNGNNSVINVMSVRAGKIVLSDNYPAMDAGIDLSQTLTSFIMRYCDGIRDIHKEILVSEDDDFQAAVLTLTNTYGKKIKIVCPKKGEKKKLVDMSLSNASEYLLKSRTSIDRQYDSTVGACAQLKELLALPTFPSRIECYDISNVSGVDKVSSMVVFTNGQKDAKAYRRFKIRTVEGANDFACMEETLERRLARLDDELFNSKRPDLIVVDGGLGQLEYARRAMEKANENITLISLAEEEEIVYTLRNKVGIRLPKDSFALNLLINIRDEAHRFAITYFRNLHNKNGLKSVLEQIEGVGKKRMISLMRYFRNVENISNATVEELRKVEGMTDKVAQSVYDYFNK